MATDNKRDAKVYIILFGLMICAVFVIVMSRQNNNRGILATMTTMMGHMNSNTPSEGMKTVSGGSEQSGIELIFSDSRTF
jgi:hypothetical protein